MKRFIFVIVGIILLIPFTEAEDINSIDYIGNDIIVSHDGEKIILHNETLQSDKKCPAGYHVGTAEDRSKIIKFWYDIKGQNYEYMKLKNGDFYEIEESRRRDSCGGYYLNGSRANEDKNCKIPSGDDFGLPQLDKDLKINATKKVANDIGKVKRYKTSSSGPNRKPYVLVYGGNGNKMGWSYKIQFSTCTNGSNGYNGCDDIKEIRCFKNDENTIANNGFSKEYNDAYIFAFNNKITTMPTIEQANMTGEIIRAEIAKMLSNWVKKFGYYADPSIPCNFTDTSSVKGDLATAIIESCQYGIMGQGINQFRPYDKITKAEVATAVSRILRGPKYDGGTPFYINHVSELKNNGILLDDNNINSNELRGNVMATLMRANKILEYNSIDCETTEYILLCADDKERCPEKCRNN